MISWPDFGVPDSAEPIFQLKSMVDDLQTAGKTQAQRPPVVVHCSAGIGRTGSYMTISIGIDSLLNTGRCNIINTVKRIRGQRALSVQTADQYELCYTSLLEYAALHVASIEPREKIDILEFLNNWKKTQPDEHRWWCARNWIRIEFEMNEFSMTMKACLDVNSTKYYYQNNTGNLVQGYK